MIPKIIHYCWFGKKRKPALVKECIRSWKEKLPEYKIQCWNEKNAPLDHPFVKAALKERYFAFAADYVRLYALSQQGGIYFDTDVMVIKSFDPLLKYDFFLGEELPGRINLAVAGAVPKHPLIARFLQYYDENKFDPAKPPIISTCLTDVFNEVKQELLGANDMVFNTDYFYPLPYDKKFEDYKTYVNSHTYAAHLWNHSWRTEIQYIEEKEYVLAFKKTIEHLTHNKSDRFNKAYYKNLLRKVKSSL